MNLLDRAGDRVVGWKRASGGFAVPVRATVLAVTAKRIKIRAEDADAASGPAVRYVTPEHLQPLEVPEDLGALGDDGSVLLGPVVQQATPRQLRLFAVACCRVEWDCFTEEPSRAAIIAAEQYADGQASVNNLDAARGAASRARAADQVDKMAADVAKRDARRAASLAIHFAGYAGLVCDQRTQVELLGDVFGNTPFRGRPRPGERSYRTDRDCDIFGNDFRPVAFEPQWKTPAVCGLAAAMYESRD